MNTPDKDPVAHDAHLRAALRHAPDAGLGAPTHLSAQIVAAGYRAAGERPAAARPGLAAPRKPWRLGASGALASLVLAGVIGLMWRGEPPPAVRERVADASAGAPAAVAPITEAVAPPVLGDATPVAPVASVAPVVPVAPAAAGKTEARRAATTSAPLRPAPSALPPPMPVLTPAPPPVLPTAPPSVPVQAAAPVPARARAPSAEPVQAPETAAVGTSATAPAAAPPPAAPAAVLARAAAADSARAEQSMRRALATPPPSSALSLSAAALPAVPWTSALTAGGDMQWRIDGQPRPAPSAWLQALSAQTASRWQASTDVAAAGEREVQWRRGDTLVGRLWLNKNRALWCDADGRCLAATLAPEVSAELLRSLPR